MKIEDCVDGYLRRLCGRISPGKRLAVILTMFITLSVCSIFVTVYSIYSIGKKEGELLKIEHSGRLQLDKGQNTAGSDSISSDMEQLSNQLYKTK